MLDRKRWTGKGDADISGGLDNFRSWDRRRGALALAAVLTTLPWFSGTGVSLAGPAEKPAYHFALPEEEYARCVAFSPDGRKVIAGTNAGRLWILELKEKAEPQQVQLASGDRPAWSLVVDLHARSIRLPHPGIRPGSRYFCRAG